MVFIDIFKDDQPIRKVLQRYYKGITDGAQSELVQNKDIETA